MTKFQFISELLGYINLLMETDLSTCITSETKVMIDDIFERYEEFSENTTEPNTRGDLQHHHYLIDNLLQKGFALYNEEMPKYTTAPTMTDILDTIAKNSPCIFESMAIEEYCFSSKHQSILVSL